MLTSIQPGALVQSVEEWIKASPSAPGCVPFLTPSLGYTALDSLLPTDEDLRSPLTPDMISNLYVCEIFD